MLPLAAFASMAILAVAPRAPEVYACSVGPDFDLVEDSDLIVAGRFTGWELDTDSGGAVQLYDPKQTGGKVLAYAGIRAIMRVDRVFKGNAPSEITVTSGNTVDVYDHEPKYVWIGPSGACGAFGSDPTGKYAIMGLSREDDGSYGASIFSWFYSGEGPPKNYDDRSLSRLGPLFPGYSPRSSVEIGFPWSIGVVAVILAMPLAFVVAAVWLRQRREPPI
jgi:hypothetical protein